eukprot:TRINITY_DN3110_c0_g1_i4.p1 TRINITY_DN3110_c0_g1~~TRINITY_DN3110_c0_g1_i4.p1  ORF type:complete len:269 (+),score=89.52 TRINITY_DN3110_c0_g1_i4:84-890(+)
MRIKIQFEGDYRAFAFEGDFEALQKEVSKLLGITFEYYSIQYQDEDGDHIVMRSQPEFLEALRCFQGKILRLQVVSHPQQYHPVEAEVKELERKSQALNLNGAPKEAAKEVKEKLETRKTPNELQALKSKLKMKKKELKKERKSRKQEKKLIGKQERKQWKKLKGNWAVVADSLTQEEKEKLKEMRLRLKEKKAFQQAQIFLLKSEVMEKKEALRRLKDQKRELVSASRKEIVDFLSHKQRLSTNAQKEAPHFNFTPAQLEELEYVPW